MITSDCWPASGFSAGWSEWLLPWEEKDAFCISLCYYSELHSQPSKPQWHSHKTKEMCSLPPEAYNAFPLFFHIFNNFPGLIVLLGRFIYFVYNLLCLFSLWDKQHLSNKLLCVGNTPAMLLLVIRVTSLRGSRWSKLCREQTDCRNSPVLWHTVCIHSCKAQMNRVFWRSVQL